MDLHVRIHAGTCALHSGTYACACVNCTAQHAARNMQRATNTMWPTSSNGHARLHLSIQCTHARTHMLSSAPCTLAARWPCCVVCCTLSYARGAHAALTRRSRGAHAALTRRTLTRSFSARSASRNSWGRRTCRVRSGWMRTTVCATIWCDIEQAIRFPPDDQGIHSLQRFRFGAGAQMHCACARVCVRAVRDGGSACACACGGGGAGLLYDR